MTLFEDFLFLVLLIFLVIYKAEIAYLRAELRRRDAWSRHADRVGQVIDLRERREAK